MNFKDLHPNLKVQRVKELFKALRSLVTDHRFRSSLVLLFISIILLMSTYIVYSFKQISLDGSVKAVSYLTQQLEHRQEVKRQHQQIPKFEASMQAVGAYNPLLSYTQCASQVTYCFLQKTKPQIKVSSKVVNIDPIHTLGSFTIDFKSSFDYEIFDMMEYIFTNPNKFGLSRLREFEIEQLFETSPIVKGRFVYDQLSLKP
jgi:hypothetical protein